MKAYRLQYSASRTALVEEYVPRPKAAPGEIVVKVNATAITPTELMWYPTRHTKDGSARQGAIPCHEFSGEVAECGEGVQDFSIGQEVYGMNDWFDEGALAEYCVTRPHWMAPKPRFLCHEAAAAVPISALTAWQGLFDRARIQPADRVLIHGGAGSVGMFAVQLAHLWGAKVLTTVSARDVGYVKSLGADVALDYRTRSFEALVTDVDIVFDTVGGDTLRRSWQVLKPEGRLITIAADSEAASEERTKQAFFIVQPSRTQLQEVGEFLDTGKLQLRRGHVASFSAASQSFAGTLGSPEGGKLVISMREPASLTRNQSRISDSFEKLYAD